MMSRSRSQMRRVCPSVDEQISNTGFIMVAPSLAGRTVSARPQAGCSMFRAP
jgi:hypothetical protein